MSAPLPLSSEILLRQATAAQKAGRLSEAERLYRVLIESDNQSAPAHHNLGIICAQRNETHEALRHFEFAVHAAPDNSLFYLSCARAQLLLNCVPEAAATLKEAIRLGAAGPQVDKLLAEARYKSHNLDPATLYASAMQHHQERRLQQAEALYRQVVARNPQFIEAWENLGHLLGSQGRLDDAVAAYFKALEIAPDNAKLLCNLGHAFAVGSRADEAIAAYRQAISVAPDYAEAHFQLGSVLSENGHVAEGFQHFMRRAALLYGGETSQSAELELAHKIKHDLEQRDYLAGGKASQDSPAVGDMFVIEDGSRLPGPAVNPVNATSRTLEDWLSSSPQMVVLDNFLTAGALEKLRRYCAGSTIWRRVYQAGYLGATPQDGFACPLLAQIAEEIRSTFPRIFALHQFQYLGAFKYDSELSTGTNIHADNSAVNVNFYITPDDANLDPETGGMDIWDVTVPASEEMRKYNSNEALTLDFVRSSGARKTVIPHRANRAIFFRSDHIHKTSDCSFKEGYLNKRINVSLLFGRRGDPTR